ncbi:MAG: ATP synthase F1 subunit delta [Candidatus Eisenbacteria bacterium]|nr:ATP synthase F1 subunit delta [Candidatus Eisenbacteria bacterium]
MNDSSVSGRYARALFLLVEKQSAKAGVPILPVLEQTLEELKGLESITTPGTRAGNFFMDPQVSPADRRRVLDQALQGKVLPNVRVFADLLLRKKRLVLIAPIAREFQAIVERVKGLDRATVVSAVALGKDELDRLHRELEKVTGKKIVLETQVDPALIGGAFVRIGDRVIDRSVKSLLASLAHQLYEVSV